MARIGISAFVLVAATLGGAAVAKLPALSDEAKAKAAEAAAKTAWAGKVDSFKLCKSLDQVAAGYFAQLKKEGKPAKTPVDTPPCADPGPFVYPPLAAVTAPPAPPIEAAGAHSPAKTAASPPSTKTPAAAVPVKK